MKSYLSHFEHTDTVCYSLLEALAAEQPISNGVTGRCGRIEVQSGNPLLNILYGIANVAENTKRIHNLTRTGGRLSYLISGLPEAEAQRMESYLAVWAHNTGLSGLTTALQTVPIPTHGKNVQERVNLISQRLKNHYTRAAQGNPVSIQRAEEVSKYLPDMISEYSTMQTQSGQETGKSNFKCMDFQEHREQSRQRQPVRRRS